MNEDSTITGLRGGISTENALRERVRELAERCNEWQARHQGVTSLWEALQTSYDQLQGDYRRLSQAHQEILLAHGQLLREVHRPATPLTATPAPSGDCGIVFTEQMECNRHGCPTSPPHRHITPPATPKMPGRGVPPCPDRINDIQGSASANQVSDTIKPRVTNEDEAFALHDAVLERRKRIQATLDDDFGDSDVIPRRNPNSSENHFKNGRTVPSNSLPPSLDINQGPPMANTREKGGAQGNPNEALQQLRDSARIASKFADAGGEPGPHVVDWHEEGLNEAAELGIAEGIDRLRMAKTIAHAEGPDHLHLPDPLDPGLCVKCGADPSEHPKQGEQVSDIGFRAEDGTGTSDETRNIPDKQTEDR